MTLRVLLFFCCLLPVALCATHNRAGEIVVESLGCDGSGDPNSVVATIITYTEIAQTEVDRDSLTIFWGDGSSEVIGRTLEQIVGDGRIKRNEYRMTHQYSGAGRYFIFFQDANRVANIQNIRDLSVNIPFSVYTSYRVIAGGRSGGCNNSPQLTQPPIDEACIGSVWTHNPGAFDVDGDSLVFEFTTPTESPDNPITSYVLPSEVGNTSGEDIVIDRQTGQITWDAPVRAGEYVLAFNVISFRFDQPVDTLVRDMMIFVRECSNDPPELEIADEEICVVAGELVEFPVIATAPLTDEDERVLLTATGAPFLLEQNRATFTPENDDFLDDPNEKIFRWQTTCADISNQEYFVVFRAQDNGFGNEQGLSTIRVVSIRVVAPPPEGVAVEPDDEVIEISWDFPYQCADSEQPVFEGFTVWRREGSNNFPVDTCETGLAGRGYTLLTPRREEVRETRADGRYFYLDEDIERGRTYCYRIVGLFVRLAQVGANQAELALFESVPSVEVCSQLPRDIPLLTQVDVTETDANNGEINVCWTPPDAEALDTLQNQGPYRYVLSRATGQTADASRLTEVFSVTRETFGEPVDTCFLDQGLNTVDNAYTYQIDFFVENETEPIAEANPASSVFLGGAPTDEAIELSWTELVPWTNQRYVVFRQLPGETTFDSIATIEGSMSYRDEGLLNGEEYCYFIRAEGTYGVAGLPSPLLNRSQIVCLRPNDNVPPCPPTLEVVSVCDRGVDCTETDNLFNTLNWTSPLSECGDEDVAGYRIYFAPDSISEPQFLINVPQAGQLSAEHRPEGGITGCYTVTAVDENGNESEPSNIVCVVNCPIYDLPNAFTPNNDGANDLFVPRGLCFVESVELQIFNRWGQLVFETEDPAINWDGRNLNGEALPSGTYYYVGRVFERRLEGVVPAMSPLSGYIELFTTD